MARKWGAPPLPEGVREYRYVNSRQQYSQAAEERRLEQVARETEAKRAAAEAARQTRNERAATATSTGPEFDEDGTTVHTGGQTVEHQPATEADRASWRIERPKAQRRAAQDRATDSAEDASPEWRRDRIVAENWQYTIDSLLDGDTVPWAERVEMAQEARDAWAAPIEGEYDGGPVGWGTEL